VVPAHAGTHIPEPVIMGPRLRGDDSMHKPSPGRSPPHGGTQPHHREGISTFHRGRPARDAKFIVRINEKQWRSSKFIVGSMKNNEVIVRINGKQWAVISARLPVPVNNRRKQGPDPASARCAPSPALMLRSRAYARRLEA